MLRNKLQIIVHNLSIALLLDLPYRQHLLLLYENNNNKNVATSGINKRYIYVGGNEMMRINLLVCVTVCGVCGLTEKQRE